MTNIGSNTADTIPVAQSVQPATLMDIPLTPNTPIAIGTIVVDQQLQLNPKMKLCIKKAKLVNILCLIDILFAVVYSLYYPIFLISIICSLTGYFGSKKFNYQLTLLYIMYLIFNIIFRVVNFIYVITSINNDDLLFTIISFVVLFFVEFIISYIVISYYKLLKNLLKIEVKYLRTNLEVQKQFICNY